MTDSAANSTVTLEIEAGVATITLNRPERLNAINPAMDLAMHEAFARASADPATRVIVLTGAGRGFCSGAERGTATGSTPAPAPSWQPVPDDMQAFRFNFLLNVPQPVIAAINGAAVGIGLVMACYCDIRLGMSNAALSFLYPKLGLVAEYGIAKHLSDLIGQSRARELLLTGRTFSAEQAQTMGLVHETYTPDAFREQVQQYAQNIAQTCSLSAHRVIKQQMQAASSQSLLECIQTAGRELISIRQTPDYIEALAARKEKRAPVFTGR